MWNSNHVLLLPSERVLMCIPVNTIIRVEACSNYSRVFCNDRDYPVVVARVLKWFEDQRPLASFIRIHRTHLINPEHIKNVGIQDRVLQLYNAEILPIAKRRKARLLKEFRSRESVNGGEFLPGIFIPGTRIAV